jgi:hypothetical protein
VSSFGHPIKFAMAFFVMERAEPHDFERLAVIVMVGVDIARAAALADAPGYGSPSKSPLHLVVSAILLGVASNPLLVKSSGPASDSTALGVSIADTFGAPRVNPPAAVLMVATRSPDAGTAALRAIGCWTAHDNRRDRNAEGWNAPVAGRCCFQRFGE